MTFEEWLAYGQDQGWASQTVCQTHDLVPLTKDESEELETGGDPCVPVVRLWGVL